MNNAYAITISESRITETIKTTGNITKIRNARKLPNINLIRNDSKTSKCGLISPTNGTYPTNPTFFE